MSQYPAFISHTVHLKNDSIFSDGALYAEEKNDPEKFMLNVFKSFNVIYPRFHKMDNMSKAGFIAAEILLQKANPVVDEFKRGLIFQNSSSSSDTDLRYQQSVFEIASPALFVYTLPNIVMGEIAIRNHFKGENTFFISEQFNATQLVDYILILFNEGILTQAIVGYIEVNDQHKDVFLCLIEKEGIFELTKNNMYELKKGNLGIV